MPPVLDSARWRRLWQSAARRCPRRCPRGDRGAAGVRDTPSDRAMSAPRSRRQARAGRPATAGPRRQARDKGSRRKAQDALPDGSQSPPRTFGGDDLTVGHGRRPGGRVPRDPAVLEVRRPAAGHGVLVGDRVPQPALQRAQPRPSERNLAVHLVRGQIALTWAGLGALQSRLGYPVTDEYAVPGGRASDFEHGRITWNAATGATTVTYS